MWMPHAHRARVGRRKVVDYLLSHTHLVGRHKARYFESLGFTVDRPDELAAALRLVAREGVVVEAVVSEFGTRYIVDGVLRTPKSATPAIRTIWMIQAGADIPEFVTAYPRRSKGELDV
jgi:hypothetical protein